MGDLPSFLSIIPESPLIGVTAMSACQFASCTPEVTFAPHVLVLTPPLPILRLLHPATASWGSQTDGDAYEATVHVHRCAEMKQLDADESPPAFLWKPCFWFHVTS